MADDDNPFADSTRNPFEAENPFSGPYDGGKAGEKQPLAPRQMEPIKGKPANDNPFILPSQPAVYTTAPAYGASSAPAFDSSMDPDSKLAALKQYEQELQKKDAALKKKEQELAEREALGLGPRPNNWPRCFPVMHHDIQGEIPAECRNLIRRMYFIFYAHTWCYLWNFVVQFWAVVDPSTKAGSATGCALAAFYLAAGPPIALYFWYVPLYTFFRTGKSTRYVIFFINFSILMGLMLFWCIGVASSGGSGIVTLIALFNADYKTAGLFCLMVILCWIGTTIFGIFTTISIHRWYRGRGGDLRRDTNEVAQGLAAQGAQVAWRQQTATA